MTGNPVLLTTSDFVRGFDCPVRLQHALERLPSTNDADEFMRLFAEGGFQFEALVRAAWPGELLGRTIGN